MRETVCCHQGGEDIAVAGWGSLKKEELVVAINLGTWICKPDATGELAADNHGYWPSMKMMEHHNRCSSSAP
ncbi:hypothetical protein ACLOJK_022820, partial [Asimina triloba]